MPIVVNLFGGPGCGKSTGAAYITSILKMHGYKAEYVTEAAKDLTWDKNWDALDDQMYVSGLQSHKLRQCKDVDIIVTDSPLVLGIVYNKSNPMLNAAIKYEFDQYDNINFFLNREKEYVALGRKQTEEQARQLDVDIKDMLYCNDIEYEEVVGNLDGYGHVIKQIMAKKCHGQNC